MFSLIQHEVAVLRRQAMLDAAAAECRARQARRAAVAPVSTAQTQTTPCFSLVPRYLRYAAASLASIAFGIGFN